MKTYVTADTHFFHEKLVRDKIRPVASVEEMNSLILDGIASTCKDGDLLYILGDVVFGGSAKSRAVAQMLNSIGCEKRLVLGNHDGQRRWPKELKACFTQILDAKIVRLHKTTIFMSHYPLQVDSEWRGGVISLHGHSHGRVHNPPGRLDVGVDPSWVYYGIPKPFLIEEAMSMALEDLPKTN